MHRNTGSGEEQRPMEEEMMPHVLMFPFPIQGHMPPMLKLAELLSNVGLYVTFVNTEYSHGRFMCHSSALARLEQRPRFRFRTIPDGLPKDDPRSALHFMVIEESLRVRSRESYRELLTPTSGQDPDGWPPVSCVIADAVLPLALDVAEEVGIHVLIFRTGGACSFWAFHCIPELVKVGVIPFPEDANLDEIVSSMPGMEGFLRRRDLPSFCRDVKSSSNNIIRLLKTVTTNAARAEALIINTFESLEAPMLSHVRSLCPITYAVGPLHTFVKTSIPQNELASSTNSVNMWEEDCDCIRWLDMQLDKSVVYVSFGSIAVLSREELMEFWQGLVDSGKRFLWVVRPDLVAGGSGEKGTIPEDVEDGTRQRGCIVGWAPQDEVLAHPAVGCFLTHSGWNSTLESIARGVPMICWPFFNDQQVNSRFVSAVWKIGVDMKDKIGRSIVAEMINNVMDGEGEELRRSIVEMAEGARISVEKGGSSYIDFLKLVQHIESLCRSK